MGKPSQNPPKTLRTMPTNDDMNTRSLSPYSHKTLPFNYTKTQVNKIKPQYQLTHIERIITSHYENVQING